LLQRIRTGPAASFSSATLNRVWHFSQVMITTAESYGRGGGPANLRQTGERREAPRDSRKRQKTCRFDTLRNFDAACRRWIDRSRHRRRHAVSVGSHP
jgi:hypothetical protein